MPDQLTAQERKIIEEAIPRATIVPTGVSGLPRYLYCPAKDRLLIQKERPEFYLKRQARIEHLYFVAKMGRARIAETMGLGPRTVERELTEIRRRRKAEKETN